MPLVDPVYPPVWRSDTALQFGAAGRLVLRDLRPWQLSLIARLQEGMTDRELDRFPIAVGVPAATVRAFVARLRPVLASPGPAAPEVGLVVAPGTRPEVDAEVRRRLAARGTVVDGPAPGILTVVVAHYEIDPAVSSRLMREDICHVPVVLSPERAEVGPLVVPGSGACPMCLAAHRRDRDAAWPLVAAQLLSRPCPPLDPLLVGEAAILAAQLVSCDDAPTDRVVTLRPGSARRSWRVPGVHPDCACRSPAGNATAPAAIDPRPAPTTARGYAQPA